MEEQPKILYPLPEGGTLLSNIINQLDQYGLLDEIVVYVGDKTPIRDYLKTKMPKLKTSLVTVTSYFPNLGTYFQEFHYEGPTTFVFGDVYFPRFKLVTYLRKLREHENDCAACLAVSRTPVGDYRVKVSAERVVEIAKNEQGEYFTAGVFSIIRPAIVTKISPHEKFTDCFVEVVGKGYFVRFIVLDGLIDIDTQKEVEKLKTPQTTTN